MQKTEYKNIYDQEETHFFYKHTHALVLSLMQRYNVTKKPRILDAGCGTGLLGKKLQRYGSVVGVDMSQEALLYAKKRKLVVTKGSLTALPFKQHTFHIVICVDVIYHRMIKNDFRALQELYRVLKPGGILIIRVPANPWLHLSHDAVVHTRERYTKQTLLSKMSRAGFIIEKISFVNVILLPIALMQSFFEQYHHKKTSSVRSLPKSMNALVYALLLPEQFLLRYMNLPWGMGLLAVGRKRRDA